MVRVSVHCTWIVLGTCLFACSAPSEGESPGSGGMAHAGGKSSGGFTSGGTTLAAGGSLPNGSGGSTSGGTTANSGGASSGGSPAMERGGAGGTASGGSNTSGGMNAAGGYTASGGRSAGGRSGSGGDSNASRGGANAGGASGGTSATGGSGGTLKKFVGNITTRDSVDTNGMKFSKYWDQITPENSGKWGSVQSTPTSAFNWTALDALYDYTQKNNILFKQHCFVWGSQQPKGTPTLAQVESWIKAFCERYPNTKLIDVVNEPPPHTTPSYTANLGAGESGTYGWITKAFKLARQHCPNAILILNDYNNIEYGDQENHFIDIVNQIKAAGAPIDAVGAQSHALKGLSAATVQANINTMASKTGLPVYITEYDIGEADDAKQLSIYQAQFPIFLNTAAVHGVTVWGWINGSTWVANTGLMNGTKPRSAMTWLMGQLGRPVPPN